MPKPTLTIGGTITTAEAHEIAEMLARDACPPIACEEGDEHPTPPPHDEGGAVQPGFYLEAIREAAKHAVHFHIGFYDRADSPRELMQDTGLGPWLEARNDRLAWRYYEPTHKSDHDEYYDGVIFVAGHGAPTEPCSLGSIVQLDSEDRLVIEVGSLDDDKDEDALIAVAKACRAVAGFFPPPLVIID